MLLYYFVIKILNTIQWGSSPHSSTVFKTAGFTLKLFIFVYLFSANFLQKATFKTTKTKQLLCYIITNTWNINEVNYLGEVMVRVW